MYRDFENPEIWNIEILNFGEGVSRFPNIEIDIEILESREFRSGDIDI